MVITITILSLLLAGATIVFVFGFKAVERLTDEVKYLENIIDAKNDALLHYVDAYQEKYDEVMDLKASMNKKKPVGRPKGSKNKVAKPKFDKQKFNDKYGK